MDGSHEVDTKKPDKFLELHGKTVGKVYMVWSAGDSDFGYETILYVTPKGKPRTAVMVGEDLVIEDGWDQFPLK